MREADRIGFLLSPGVGLFDRHSREGGNPVGRWAGFR
jgi:hypothetical protein